MGSQRARRPAHPFAPPAQAPAPALPARSVRPRKPESDRPPSHVDDLAWVAAAVHDLRDPLHTAASFLALLSDRSGDRLDDDGRHCLDQAARAVESSLALVRSTLDWASAGAVRPAPTDAGTALADALRLLDGPLRRAGARVEGDAGPLPWVRADPAALRRILQNLLSNALRHGGDGVHVRVGARRAGRGWWLEVEDDGPGLPPGVDLFEPFRHGPRSDGTGLGLAYVRRAAEGCGGRVEAGASALGGARVAVWLPEARRPKGSTAPAPGGPEPARA